jgi:fructokinase
VNEHTQSTAVSIIAIGEALVDIVDTAAAGSVEHPGGSPMNVAFGLARLGERVQLLTALGDDARGHAIVAHLQSAGVSLFPGSLTDRRTSTATAHLDATGAAEYEFDIEWSLDNAPADLTADLVHIGSIGAFLEPGASTVETLVAAAHTHSLITFDPNIRPALMGSRMDAVARFERLAGFCTLVKMSDEDAAWLYPGVEFTEVLTRVLKLGPVVAAITLGAQGAAVATAGKRIVLPGATVVVADTIGAGDSFMSALIHSAARLLAAGVSPAALRDGSAFTPERLTALGEFAVNCAAITVSRAGANPPSLADVEAARLFA